MVVSGNIVQNCSIGLQQRYRKGEYLNESDYLLNYTGSLFTFQDILRVEFHNNSFTGVYPFNNWDFYLANSPFYKHLGQGVLTSFNSTQEATNYVNTDHSSAMIVASNVYDFNMQNCSLNNALARRLADAVLLHSINGMKDLAVKQLSVSNLEYAYRELFNLRDISYAYYKYSRNPLKLKHNLSLQDVNITLVTISPSEQLGKDASLLFNNLNGSLVLQDLNISNVQIHNISTQVPVAADISTRISGILQVEAEKIVIDNLNVSLVDLRPTDSTLSPIGIQLYNLSAIDPTSPLYTKPTLNIVNCRFKGIQTAHAATIPIA